MVVPPARSSIEIHHGEHGEMQGNRCDAETPSPRLVVQRGREMDQDCDPFQTDLRTREISLPPEVLRASVLSVVNLEPFVRGWGDSDEGEYHWANTPGFQPVITTTG